MTAPVPESGEVVVARLRLPVRVTGLDSLSDALAILYGDGLVMVADGDKEWLTIVQPDGSKV